MERTNGKLLFGLRLLGVFVFGWVALAVFAGVVLGHASSGLKAPLFGVILLLDSEGAVFWLNLLIVIALLVSVSVAFLKRRWAKTAYLAIGMMIVYWGWCALLLWLASKA